MSDTAQKLCALCCCVASSTLIILLIVSFSSLEVNEYGLDYSSISKTVEPLPFSGGIHFLGVGHSFIRYPKTVQTIQFSTEKGADGPPLQSRTSDGLEVTLEISFQFLLKYEDLFKLFNIFKDNYKLIFRDMAIDVLSQNATQYSAYDFFVDRQRIGTNMQIVLNKHFTADCFASIEFFQLRNVDLPDQFEDAIQLSEVQKQSIQKSYAQKNKTVVQLKTENLMAEYQKNVTINLAQGDAAAVIQNGQAVADSIKVVQETNAQSYTSLKTQLKMQNSHLIQFIQTKVMREHSDESLVVSLKNMESLVPPDKKN